MSHDSADWEFGETASEMDDAPLVHPVGFLAPFVSAKPKRKAMAVTKEIAKKAEPAVGVKFDHGKARIDLIAPELLFALGEILAFGADKYGDRNWEKGMAWGRLFAAMMRHLWAWWGSKTLTKENFAFGELDLESARSHLWHAACCLMMLVAFEARGHGTDDRFQCTKH